MSTGSVRSPSPGGGPGGAVGSSVSVTWLPFGAGALVVSGHGLSTNSIEASLEAYLVATNKLHGAEINGVSVGFVSQRMAEELP